MIDEPIPPFDEPELVACLRVIQNYQVGRLTLGELERSLGAWVFSPGSMMAGW